MQNGLLGGGSQLLLILSGDLHEKYNVSEPSLCLIPGETTLPIE